MIMVYIYALFDNWKRLCYCQVYQINQLTGLNPPTPMMLINRNGLHQPGCMTNIDTTSIQSNIGLMAIFNNVGARSNFASPGWADAGCMWCLGATGAKFPATWV